MTARRLGHALSIAASISLASVAFAAQPAAQPAQQTSGAMQGFQINRDQPVKIESATLEVRDKIRQAVFAGNVKLTQGDTTIQCKSLVVFYDDNSASAPTQTAAKGAQPAPAPAAQKSAAGFGGGSQQIRRVEAKGDVLVTQKDQTAAGENGVFDIKTNSITLSGNVVVTQGESVLRGERMVVDLTSGVTRVESKSTGRVQGMFSPSAPAPGSPPQGAQPAAPAQKAKPAPSAKSAPGAPIRINQNMAPKKPAG